MAQRFGGRVAAVKIKLAQNGDEDVETCPPRSLYEGGEGEAVQGLFQLQGYLAGFGKGDPVQFRFSPGLFLA